MNMKALALLLATSLASSAVCALEAMEESAMGAVVGGDGIAIGLDYGVNTDQSGAPLASLSSCAGTGNPCKFAYKLAAREDGGGAWTVFKDSYMSLKIPILNIGVLPAMSAVASNQAYFDDTRFRNAGVCLLPGAVCTAANIDTLPALMLFYPATTTSYTPVSTTGGTSAGYTSLSLGMVIGRMALEFGATGYNTDANGSFLGARIADNNGNFANMAISGKAYVYGF